jgi:hypothetical protein
VVVDDHQWLSEDIEAEPAALLRRLRAPAGRPAATPAHAARDLVGRTAIELWDDDTAGH